MKKFFLAFLILLTTFLVSFGTINTTFVSCDNQTDIRNKQAGPAMICILYGLNSPFDGLGGIYRLDTTAAKRALQDDSFHLFHINSFPTGVWVRDSLTIEANGLHYKDTISLLASKAYVIAYVAAHQLSGPTGATGTSGSDGLIGPTGISGTNGTNGIQGSTGLQGIQGISGVTGATGIQGS